MAIYSENNGNELTLTQAHALPNPKKIILVKKTTYVPQPSVKVKFGPGEIDKPVLPLAVETEHVVVYAGADIPSSAVASL